MSKRSRTFRITIYEDPEFIQELDEALDHVVSILEVGEMDYLRSIVIEGILKKQVEFVNAGKYGALDAKVAKIRQSAYEKKRLFAKLDTIYKEEGPAGVFACSEMEPELTPELVQEFMLRYTWRNEEQSDSKRAQDWLREFLADGKPHSTTEIRQSAQRDGIIGEAESEWSNLKVTATRMNLSQAATRGYWQLPQTIPLRA